jgi:hypothetical protein
MTELKHDAHWHRLVAIDTDVVYYCRTCKRLVPKEELR